MKTLKIKGVEYNMGSVRFNDANVDVFSKFLSLYHEPEKSNFADVMQSGFLRDFHRMLMESLTDGCGPDKAEEAMDNMTLNFNEGSDMVCAIGALVELIAGEE